MFIDDKLFDAIQYALNWGNNVPLNHDEYKDTYTLASELGRIKREQEKKSLQERFDQMEENIFNHVITEATNQFVSNILNFGKWKDIQIYMKFLIFLAIF
jgi:hypothetical protein